MEFKCMGYYDAEDGTSAVPIFFNAASDEELENNLTECLTELAGDANPLEYSRTPLAEDGPLVTLRLDLTAGVVGAGHAAVSILRIAPDCSVARDCCRG